jgi:hypothetical protein
MVEGTLWLH